MIDCEEWEDRAATLALFALLPVCAKEAENEVLALLFLFSCKYIKGIAILFSFFLHRPVALPASTSTLVTEQTHCLDFAVVHGRARDTV